MTHFELPAPKNISLENTTSQTSTCNSTRCSPGKTLSLDTCKCICIHTYSCLGQQNFNKNSCQCECPQLSYCRQNEYFDTYLCSCVRTIFQLPNKPRVIPILPIPPPIYQPNNEVLILPQPCLEQTCSGHKVFDTVKCRCHCPLTTRRYCIGPKVFDESSCECVCPNSLVYSCSTLKYFDHSECSCKCRIFTRTLCNNLQKFNPSSCRCECKQVLVTTYTQVYLEEPVDQRHKRNSLILKEHERMRSNLKLTSKRHAVDKRSPRSRKKSKATTSRTRSYRTDQRVSVSQRQEIIERKIISYSCPVGTTLDKDSCSCV